MHNNSLLFSKSIYDCPQIISGNEVLDSAIWCVTTLHKQEDILQYEPQTGNMGIPIF